MSENALLPPLPHPSAPRSFGATSRNAEDGRGRFSTSLETNGKGEGKDEGGTGGLSSPVVTLGCRLNIAESETIAALIAPHPGTAVVNGCAVTAEAVRSTARAARRLRRERPDARILVTGCAAQVDPGRFAAMPEVDGVIGNAEKLDPATYAADAPRIRVSSILEVMRTSPHLAVAFDQTRAFIEVGSGCDHACTFCIIPAGRGPSQSHPVARIVDAVRAAVDAGRREVVLTGVDLTSYDDDDGTRLGGLVEAILDRVPALPRLRLSSLDPAEIDGTLLALYRDADRLMPHVHLSMQAGDDMILKRMRRRHLRADALRLVDRLRALRPGILFGADLIAGFPTEDDAMAANGVRFVEEAGIAFAHVFPYSARPGTPAARMPQVAPTVAKARAAALREASARVRDTALDALVGTDQSMLVERDGLTGHAATFAALRLTEPAAPGALLPVTVGARDGGTLLVEPR